MRSTRNKAVREIKFHIWLFLPKTCSRALSTWFYEHFAFRFGFYKVFRFQDSDVPVHARFLRFEGSGEGGGNSVMSEASLVVRFMKSFHESCEIPASESCELLSGAETFPQNEKNKKTQNKYATKRKETHISKCRACHGSRRDHYRCHSRNRLKTVFLCCVCAYDKPSVACCNRLQSNTTHKFLRTTYMTSSCTQRPPRPGFYDAKCSCIFPAFYHCLDFFLF